MKEEEKLKIIRKQLITTFCYYKGEMPDEYSSFWDRLSKSILEQIK